MKKKGEIRGVGSHMVGGLNEKTVQNSIHAMKGAAASQLVNYETQLQCLCVACSVEWASNSSRKLFLLGQYMLFLSLSC